MKAGPDSRLYDAASEVVENAKYLPKDADDLVVYVIDHDVAQNAGHVLDLCAELQRTMKATNASIRKLNRLLKKRVERGPAGAAGNPAPGQGDGA